MRHNTRRLMGDENFPLTLQLTTHGQSVARATTFTDGPNWKRLYKAPVFFLRSTSFLPLLLRKPSQSPSAYPQTHPTSPFPISLPISTMAYRRATTTICDPCLDVCGPNFVMVCTLICSYLAMAICIPWLCFWLFLRSIVWVLTCGHYGFNFLAKKKVRWSTSLQGIYLLTQPIGGE